LRARAAFCLKLNRSGSDAHPEEPVMRPATAALEPPATGWQRFVDPRTGEPLRQQGDHLVAPDGRAVASIVAGIARFVEPSRHYAEAFGFQWKTWRTLSDAMHGGQAKRDEILHRTHFEAYPTAGASILECGMGGGDDTEVLLQLGFAEVHSFDLSEAVERAADYLKDPRLTLSQASIFEIPYADESFDFVFCHRVLQHTPDPAGALRAVCRKVRPGGVLFAHCYKRSPAHMRCFKYKYRWLTRRLPHPWVYAYVKTCGPLLHRLNDWLVRRWGSRGHRFVYEWVPYYRYPVYRDLSPERLLQLEALNTFDALTPRYDDPMTTQDFCGIIESEGFRIEHLHDPDTTPIYCTAVKTAG
jgi:2-polyprenyl-3-methyl-5-hydroxy-6-metoxy-1,4-benzoquinol methylase